MKSRKKRTATRQRLSLHIKSAAGRETRNDLAKGINSATNQSSNWLKEEKGAC